MARIVSLFKKAKLPVNPPAGMDALQFLDLMSVDKKNSDGKIRLILLEQIGRATLPTHVNQELLEMTLKNYGRE
jgi:3-dehydroquinate synthase